MTIRSDDTIAASRKKKADGSVVEGPVEYDVSTWQQWWARISFNNVPTASTEVQALHNALGDLISGP